MRSQTFKPSPKYLSKLRLNLTLAALITLASGMLLGFLLSLDESIGPDVFRITSLVTLGLDLLWWIPGMLLTAPYYRSLSYEVQDDEVIVRAGILTKSVKHVPYRTVTNLTVNRGPFDRWFFDLGTLNIQTAGMSGNTGAEESLAGLPNYDEVYELVATELRRFRGGMAPTAAEVEEATESASTSLKALNGLMVEVKAIRKLLEQKPS